MSVVGEILIDWAIDARLRMYMIATEGTLDKDIIRLAKEIQDMIDNLVAQLRKIDG